jgi:hypothetical protein
MFLSEMTVHLLEHCLESLKEVPSENWSVAMLVSQLDHNLVSMMVKLSVSAKEMLKVRLKEHSKEILSVQAMALVWAQQSGD